MYVDATVCLSIYLLMNTACFHILAVVNNATINISVQVSIWVSTFSSIGHLPRRGIAVEYGTAF